MKILSKIVAITIPLLAACANLDTPSTKDYQISACTDVTDAVMFVTSAEGFAINSLNANPIGVTNKQVLINNSYFDAGLIEYQTQLTWTQDSEAMELDFDMVCFEKNLNSPSACFSLKSGKIANATYKTTIVGVISISFDISYRTLSKSQPSQILGKLIYATKSVSLDLQEIPCHSQCVTTKAGIATLEDDTPAKRECSFACDNGFSGTLQTTCASNACEGEEDVVKTAISNSISCAAVNSDASSLPPVIAPLAE